MASERRPAAFTSVDFGQRLRTAREKQGASLREIAETTKISINILEALEANDLRRLPGGIFTRSFVKAYAGQVGLDPDQTLLEFQRAFPDHAPAPDRVPADLETTPPAADRRLWPLALVATLVVALGAGGTAWYRGWRPGWLPAPLGAWRAAAGGIQPSAPALPAPETSAGQPGPATVLASNAPASPSDTATPVTPAPSPDTATPSPVAVTAAPSAAPEAPASAETAAAVPRQAAPGLPNVASPTAGDETPSSGRSPLRLTVQPTGPCWVKVSADGTVQVARLLQPGERLEFEAATVLQVEAGDAGAFAYTLDGKPGRQLGNPGRVARVRIDRANAASFVNP